MKLYDIIYDYALIESSFAQQYNIRLTKDEISVPEFYRLLGSLNHKTALGRIILIRGEKDAKIIKNFGAFEKRIRQEWVNWLALDSGAKASAVAGIDELQNTLFKAFG